MNEVFIRHLERASEIVSTWPEWKQNLLGRRTMNQVDQAARRAAELVLDLDCECKECEAKTVEAESIIAAEFAPLQERIIEALTPSAETKAAYIGEFQFDEESDDGRGTATRTVPWTTVKAIMSAIRERAGLAAKENGNG